VYSPSSLLLRQRRTANAKEREDEAKEEEDEAKEEEDEEKEIDNRRRNAQIHGDKSIKRR
jgi:hypothetical protein